MTPRTIGVRGARWRARVDEAGTIAPVDGTAPLAWHVAADDRWHDPAREPGVRQRWYRGTPVCETRLRVPGGDVVQKIWCLADLGGLTMMEFANESSMAVAVAVTRGDLLAPRGLSSTVPAGIDLPVGSRVLPLAHGAKVQVALAHDGSMMRPLPGDLPGTDKAVTGWLRACAVASDLTVADYGGRDLVADTVAERCEVLLNGPPPDSQAGLLESLRLGDGGEEGFLEAVAATESVVRRATRRWRGARSVPWDFAHRLANLARLCAASGDARAEADIARAWLLMADLPREPAPPTPPSGPDVVAWVETRLVHPNPAGGTAVLWPDGICEQWRGAPMEARTLTADPRRRVSLAVRWHGARPALLWEVEGPEGLVLSDGIDGAWITDEPRGEALLGDPRL